MHDQAVDRLRCWPNGPSHGRFSSTGAITASDDSDLFHVEPSEGYGIGVCAPFDTGILMARESRLVKLVEVETAKIKTYGSSGR